MKKKLLLFFLIILLTSCGNMENNIKVGGSSTVYPITLEALSSYYKVDGKVKMNVESTGTGSGFNLFAKGKLDINDASRSISKEEQEIAKDNKVNYEEFLLGYDGITIIINKDNNWVKNLSTKDIKKIFQTNTKYKTWKDINSSWPDESINLYGPTSASGTYDFFCDKIIDESKCTLSEKMSATENDNEVISNVANDKNGIGFLGYAYYKENKDKINDVSINNIKPTLNTIKSNEYLLSRPLFIYVNKDEYDKDVYLKQFVDFYIHNAQEFVSKSGYVALSDNEQKKVEQKLVR